MNCRNLRLWRKAVCFGLAENQEKRVSAAHRRFGGIVKLRVGVTVFSQLVHTLRRARAQIIEPPEHDRFSRTNFRARRCEAALLSIVAEGAFECAAGVGQRFRAPVDHAKRTRDHAISAAVANIVLHEDGADFGPNDCAGGTRFEATSFLAMLANIGEKNPAKRIFSVATHLTNASRRSGLLFVGLARQTSRDATWMRQDGRCCRRNCPTKRSRHRARGSILCTRLRKLCSRCTQSDR